MSILWCSCLLALGQSEPAYVPSARDVFTLVSWFTSGLCFWYWCLGRYHLPCFGLSHRLVVEPKTWLLDEPTQGERLSRVPALNECSVHGSRLGLVRSTSLARVPWERWVSHWAVAPTWCTTCQHRCSFWHQSCRLPTPVATNTTIARNELNVNRQP